MLKSDFLQRKLKIKERPFRTIAVLNAIALIGIIITQFFWARNGIDLREEQCNHRTLLAIQDIADEIINPQSEEILYNYNICEGNDNKLDSLIKTVIDREYMDSTIQVHFDAMNINRDYYYGIYNQNTNKIIISKSGQYHEEIISSQIKTNLTCLEESNPYRFAVYFPENLLNLTLQSFEWVLVTLIFLIIIIYSFIRTVNLYYKQQKVSEVRNAFVNNMTHEFKTPISTVSLSSEMLMNQNIYKSPEKALKYARIIQDENEKLEMQVEHILRIAQMEKGSLDLNYENLDIHQLTEQVLKNFDEVVKKRNGKIKYEFNADNPIVNADKTQLQNIISNLVDNAIKYSSCAPVITISTDYKNNDIRISVTDKGIGISKENKKEIFKQFHRVPTGNRHDVKGFGIGLYYVKSMIEEMGGSIEVESELKKGSTFIITLPISK
jgi:two-component system phosphate regulon sensor histidine kinase PhoR